MKKPITAKTNRGKCFFCKEEIVPGQEYRRYMRRATETERNDPNIKKFRPPWASGPHVEDRMHEDCRLKAEKSRNTRTPATRNQAPGNEGLRGLLP